MIITQELYDCIVQEYRRLRDLNGAAGMRITLDALSEKFVPGYEGILSKKIDAAYEKIANKDEGDGDSQGIGKTDVANMPLDLQSGVTKQIIASIVSYEQRKDTAKNLNWKRDWPKVKQTWNAEFRSTATAPIPISSSPPPDPSVSDPLDAMNHRANLIRHATRSIILDISNKYNKNPALVAQKILSEHVKIHPCTFHLDENLPESVLEPPGDTSLNPNVSVVQQSNNIESTPSKSTNEHVDSRPVSSSPSHSSPHLMSGTQRSPLQGGADREPSNVDHGEEGDDDDGQRHDPQRRPTGSKTVTKKLFNSPWLIDDFQLSYEITRSHYSDQFYGPISTTIQNLYGSHFEHHIHRLLSLKGISFLTEDDMRKKGYDVSVDFKLKFPLIAQLSQDRLRLIKLLRPSQIEEEVDSAAPPEDFIMIQWIECKALFANQACHQEYYKNQYFSYWNRFGNGLVIYKLGTVEPVVTHNLPRIIVTDLEQFLQAYGYLSN